MTIIPVSLVAAWLYAAMHLAGFSLNFVTATSGAISIGVGIDYSIHMTERFREELRRVGDPPAALRRAADGSGVALLASAGSTIVGFTIMGFAPIPLFASYGILTAVMIALALAASLLVLPALLLLVAPGPARRSVRSDAPQPRAPRRGGGQWSGRPGSNPLSGRKGLCLGSRGSHWQRPRWRGAALRGGKHRPRPWPRRRSPTGESPGPYHR